ncbi:MAG: hypothetical protein HYX53_08815 [Chloroflexi bacterium]|nr:hypothetical protein [Chloroflexota bacterium]
MGQAEEPGRSPGMWDYFKIGLLAGAVYSLLRNPQGVGCCLFLLVIIAIVVVVLLIALVLAAWKVLAALAVAWVVLQYVVAPWIRRHRDARS